MNLIKMGRITRIIKDNCYVETPNGGGVYKVNRSKHFIGCKVFAINILGYRKIIINDILIITPITSALEMYLIVNSLVIPFLFICGTHSIYTINYLDFYGSDYQRKYKNVAYITLIINIIILWDILIRLHR